MGPMTAEQRAAIEQFSTQLVNKILHYPILQLKEAPRSRRSASRCATPSGRSSACDERDQSASARAAASSRSGRPTRWPSGSPSGGYEPEIVTVQDHRRQTPGRAAGAIGGKGLFMKELEEALLRGEIDIAVHSLKDVPSIIGDDFVLAGFLERADPRDAWVHRRRNADRGSCRPAPSSAPARRAAARSSARSIRTCASTTSAATSTRASTSCAPASTTAPSSPAPA